MPSPPLPAPSGRGRSNRRTPCVLLADDDTDLTDLLTDALSEDGYRVVVARSGSAIVDYLRASSMGDEAFEWPNLIVSDVRMPQGTGIQALKSLRQLSPRPPVIMMTAFGSSTVHAEARALGAITVIDKPFDVDDFRMVVWNVIQGWGERGTA